MQLDELELHLPPVFDIGDKVRIRKLIKNDGTFPGKQVGEVLANIGDIGYIVSIGTYLQTAYIYAVHFLDKGYVVGCRKRELEAIEINPENNEQ